MKKLMMLLAAFCIFVVMLAGCSGEKERGESTTPSSSSGQEIRISQNESQETEEIVKKPEYTTIKTKYGYLFYPDRWNEFVSAKQEEKDGLLAVYFEATINGEKYILFEVDIKNTAGDPDAAGSVTDFDGNKHDVFAHMVEIPETDTLAENEVDRLYAMQEGLNDLIEALE